MAGKIFLLLAIFFFCVCVFDIPWEFIFLLRTTLRPLSYIYIFFFLINAFLSPRFSSPFLPHFRRVWGPFFPQLILSFFLYLHLLFLVDPVRGMYFPIFSFNLRSRRVVSHQYG